MPDEFLTVDEIAATLKVNQQTIRNWIDRGELGAVRVGKRRVRVRQSDLDAFVEAGTTPNPEPELEPQVDEGSVTAWATFGAALAEASSRLNEAGASSADGWASAFTSAWVRVCERLKRGDQLLAVPHESF